MTDKELFEGTEETLQKKVEGLQDLCTELINRLTELEEISYDGENYYWSSTGEPVR